MVKTWIADVEPLLTETIYSYYYRKIPKFRQEKADRIRMAQDRALSVGAWMLYEEMKAAYQIEEEAVFNLSHSGHHVLCSLEVTKGTGKCEEGSAWSQEVMQIRNRPSIRIGCDIEKIGIPRDQVAQRFLCESEWRYIDQYEKMQERKQAFYRMWVLKESFMKATGLGMKLPLNAFEIGFDEKNHPRLLRMPNTIEGVCKDYKFWEFDAEKSGCKAAVCTTGETEHQLIWHEFRKM